MKEDDGWVGRVAYWWGRRKERIMEVMHLLNTEQAVLAGG